MTRPANQEAAEDEAGRITAAGCQNAPLLPRHRLSRVVGMGRALALLGAPPGGALVCGDPRGVPMPAADVPGPALSRARPPRT